MSAQFICEVLFSETIITVTLDYEVGSMTRKDLTFVLNSEA